MQIELLVGLTGTLLFAAAVVRGGAAIVLLTAHRRRAEKESLRLFEALHSGDSVEMSRRSVSQHYPAPTNSELQPPTNHESALQLVVAKRVIENEKGDICSFYLTSADGRPLPSYAPGQFLSFTFSVLEQQMVSRCYSLSLHPTEPQEFYRISVKRILPDHRSAPRATPGLVSNALHDQLREGMIVEAMPPSGTFCLDQVSHRPIVLIAGGIGLTPLLSMLDWLAATDSSREIWLFLAVRNRLEHAFRNHLDLAAQSLPNFHQVVFYSQPTAVCKKGSDYDEEGHVSVDYMKHLLRARNYEFYLCGPDSMMQTVSQDLLVWGVPSEAVRCESFGQARTGIERRTAEIAARPNSAAVPSSDQSIGVEFARSKKRFAWSGRQNTLLELAEACGANPRFSCRAGQCGSCKIKLHSGQVEYLSQPGASIEEGTCLPCISRPTTDLVLDL